MVLNDKVSITMEEDGFYKATTSININEDELKNSSSVCPFSPVSQNEDDLGKKLFSDKKHDERIGFFNKVYTGHVVNIDDRLSSSSGGLTTWFAEKLLVDGEVDAVIHVGQTDSMFGYVVSKTVEELRKTSNKKSRYYPVTFEKLLDYIKNTQDKILFIGVPCFVKAIRLVQKNLDLHNIKFVFSLVCGHMKSAAFSESYAWQLGVSPKDLYSMDFRVKVDGYEASNYFIELKAKNSTEESIKYKNSYLFGSNWGHGFFKHKACDFCDDLAGELADVTFGDAWLPKYTKDYLGTNIIISRSDLFDKYLNKYKHEVKVEEVTVDDYYESQAGNYRHRREGLKTRISAIKGWYPKKRLYLLKESISKKRKRLYIFRQYISKRSSVNFLVAKRYNSFKIFKFLMMPLLTMYDCLNIGFIATVKLNFDRIFSKVKLKLQKFGER